MIPRTKVNYRMLELVTAAFASERSFLRRQEVVRRLAVVLGTRQIVMTASGRGALYLLLKSLPHKKVLIPGYTCKAVVEAIRFAEKEILYAEIEADGFNMPPSSVEGRLDADTILLATHQFGIPCEIEELVACARRAGAYVIEDAAASFGSRVGDRLTGTFGDAAFFSFDSTKLLNVPLKAGFLTIRDSGVFERCRDVAERETRPMSGRCKWATWFLGVVLVALEIPGLYRWFHRLKFDWRGRYTDEADEMASRPGAFYRNRFAEWQAVILLKQLDRLESIFARRRDLYAALRDRLAEARSITLPPPDPSRSWVPIRFPLRVRGRKLDFYRAGVRRGVDFAFSFTFIECPRELVRSRAAADAVLDPPFYIDLTDREFEKVVRVLLEIDSDGLEGPR